MTGPTPPLDIAEMRRQLADDDELIQEVIGLFLDDYPARLKSFTNLLAAHDQDGVRNAAHALKGGASNISASAVVDAARKLETECGGGDWAVIGTCTERLVAEVERLVVALLELRDGPAR